jgi:ABC-type multidrug transport system fused ATPase/permease subunit
LLGRGIALAENQVSVKPSIYSLPGALPAPCPIRQGFEFRNVSFGFPGSNSLIIQSINFCLELQEKAALIGESGALGGRYVELFELQAAGYR